MKLTGCVYDSVEEYIDQQIDDVSKCSLTLEDVLLIIKKIEDEDPDCEVHDYDITEAIVTDERVAITWNEDGDNFNLIAFSRDGGNYYKGNYGNGVLERGWHYEFKRFDSEEGITYLLSRWYQDDHGYGGITIFELFDGYEDE